MRPRPAGNDGRVELIGLDRGELQAVLAGLDVPARALRMRANQIYHWLYHRGAREFAAMTNIAGPLREALAERCTIARPAISAHQVSRDGTQKWLLRLSDGREVESVYIPEDDRGSLCMSSQVGCTLTCAFCHTGTQALVRNLDASEVLQQFLLARDGLGEWPSPNDGRLLSNIVMMGMGEPLLNFDNVKKALQFVMDPEGIALSKRRITLSTAGVVPMMQRCGTELGVNLAVSLHAVRDPLRDELVPINRRYPIGELLRACRAYPGSNNARRITFEYVMLHEVNDSTADARELVRLLRGIPAKVNLIPFNPWPGSGFTCSRPAAIRRFAEIVNEAGYSSPVRSPRGRDIMAACGQLKSASVKASRLKTGRLKTARAAPASRHNPTGIPA